MIDMTESIQPKSAQLNADDLIAGPMTINITGVSKHSNEQPIAIRYDGDNGKPYLPCKTVRRLMVLVWGIDGSKYVGESLTIYRDATVTWGGQEVGGIRVSHMSGITKKMSFSLTATNKSKKPYEVLPLGEVKKKKEIDLVALQSAAEKSASLGSEILKTWFLSLSSDEKLAIKPSMDKYKAMAEEHNPPTEESVM